MQSGNASAVAVSFSRSARTEMISPAWTSSPPLRAKRAPTLTNPERIRRSTWLRLQSGIRRVRKMSSRSPLSETRNSKLETRGCSAITRRWKIETRNSKLENGKSKIESRKSKLENRDCLTVRYAPLPSGSVHTGFRPTQRDENNRCGHPRVKLALSLPKGGSTSVRKKLDSRFRGNGRYGRFSNFDFPISIFHFPASVRKKLDSLFLGNGRYGRFSNFDFPFSSFHFPVSPSQPLQEKQLEHKQPGSYHNGAVGKIERGPMIA